MVERIGAVIVFKKNLNRKHAETILNSIREYIDLDQKVGENDWEKISNSLNEFDDELGGPVWYLP